MKVTISAKDSVANVNLALRVLGDHYSDDTIGERIGRAIDTADPLFSNILSTTWQELVNKGYVSKEYSYYVITGEGWKKALEAIGKLYDKTTKHNLGRLCGKLKKRIKQANRANEGYCLIDELATETKLPVQ